MKALAEEFGMLSDHSRLKIVLVLAQRKRNVTELCADMTRRVNPRSVTISRFCDTLASQKRVAMVSTITINSRTEETFLQRPSCN